MNKLKILVIFLMIAYEIRLKLILSKISMSNFLEDYIKFNCINNTISI